MHHAATRGHLDVLQLLVDFGWPVNSCNDTLETPLHLACFSGHTAIVEFLLDKGANCNAVTKDNETALFYAARKNQYRIVRILLRSECDLSIRNRFGDIAEDEATSEKTLLEFSIGREDRTRLTRESHLSSSGSSERKTTQRQREHILSYLDLISLCRASQINYRWHRAADQPTLWRNLGVSRWELLLQTTVGIQSVAPMTMLNINNGPMSVRRPSSSDHVPYSTMSGSKWTRVASSAASVTKRSSIMMGGPSQECFLRRPQTARSPVI